MPEPRRHRRAAVEPADVLVVGAGVAGAIAAVRLSEAGFRVVCLEQGSWVNPSDYVGDRAGWGLQMRKQWHSNPNVRCREEDYPCQTRDAEVAPQMFAAVGGSTILWGAQWVRFLPSDFRTATLDGVGDDWPFTYEVLEPYYERAEREFGVSGVAGDPAYPPGAGPPLPPLAIGEIGRRAAEGLNRLGWHWWPGTNAIASAPNGRLNRCARLGTCLTGCPEGAKASTDLTHWPSALESGVRLVTRARVREIRLNERGLATGAVYVDQDGREHEQRARVVVLAANGVGTPRLLLLSSSARFPDGLANSSGLVGKRLMMHPHVGVLGTYDDLLESWRGPAGQPLQSLHWYESDADRGFVRGAKWHVYPTGGPMNVLPPSTDQPFDEVWGTAHHDRIEAVVGHSFEWSLVAEDLPEESNRVTLDDELRDSSGLPAPRIAYRISENTQRMLEFHAQRACEAHEASGATTVWVHSLAPECGFHLLGTARMGTDASSSVVDQYGRSHDVPNLFVFDGSVFPTASGCNPTATIAAVAHRCVDQLVAQARLQPVAA